MNDTEYARSLQETDLRLVIKEHPEVVESVLAQMPGRRALAVVRSTGYLTGAELRRHCCLHSGTGHFDVLLVDSVPSTEEVLADPAAFAARSESAVFSEFAQPEDQLEADLLVIWERVLACEPISVLDDFVDIGGESLDAVQVAAEISQRWEVSLSLADLLDASSIRGLAKLIAAAQSGDR
jgi:acyl carrier protein